LIGHSLGGFVVLMNQALDPRFNITVAWAPLVNFDPNHIRVIQPGYEQYIPVNLLNKTNTNNLLVIMHVDDEVLDYADQALVAQSLTNCTVIPITGSLIGGGHQLFSDVVIAESIKWFELNFFKSISINGPINITFIVNYIVLFITLILLVFIVLSLISYTSKFIPYKKEVPRVKIVRKGTNLSMIIDTAKTIKQIFKILLYTTIFLLNWEIFERAFGLMGIFLASLNITVIYFTVKIIRYLRKLREDDVKFDLNQIKILIKSELQLKYLLYAIVCNFYFIAIYVIFSYFYPFAFMWPSNFFNTVLGAAMVFPVYFSLELLYRKAIYPQLSFLKKERIKTIWMLIIVVFVNINMMMLTWTWAFFPSVIFMYLILLYAIIQNTLIYENTQRFSAVILSSFILIQIFFGAVVSNALGIGSALNLFVQF